MLAEAPALHRLLPQRPLPQEIIFDKERQEMEEELPLIHQVQAGETEAFGVIFERTYPHVVSTISRFSTLSADDRADIVQDAYERALRAMPGFHQQGPLRAWISRIAQNAALDLVRRRANFRRREVALFERVPVSENPETETVRGQQAAAVHRALDDLTVSERTVVEMFHLQGYSMGEVAEAIGGTRQAAKAAALRGKKRLRESLKDWQVA